MTHDNKLQVEAIKRGTVIDHIPAQVCFTVPADWICLYKSSLRQ